MTTSAIPATPGTTVPPPPTATDPKEVGPTIPSTNKEWILPVCIGVILLVLILTVGSWSLLRWVEEAKKKSQNSSEQQLTSATAQADVHWIARTPHDHSLTLYPGQRSDVYQISINYFADTNVGVPGVRQVATYQAIVNGDQTYNLDTNHQHLNVGNSTYTFQYINTSNVPLIFQIMERPMRR